MRKRLLAWTMALCLALSILPSTVLADSTDSCAGECTHEAAIGNVHYDTLSEAISASNSTDTIRLLADIDNSVGSGDYTGGINYSLKADTTLDGNGHTISGHIGVYIPAAGAAVKNVNFMNIHNPTVVDEDTCDYYGWDSKTGNQSAIYASSLAGTATITGCTFDNIDWDAIQITPTKTASIVIKDNVFQHTNTTDTQLRYIHIQYTAGSLGVAINGLTITDNQFYVTKNPKDTCCSIGIWKVNKNTPDLQINGNYVEDYSTAEVSVIGLNYLFPARSQAGVDTDDYQPVAYDSAKVFDSLQQAVNETTKYVKMMKGAGDQSATIPAGKEIYFYSYGYDVGTLVNDGSLQIYGSDLASPSRIVNNGTMSLSGNSATVYDIENNGSIKITSGVTYDLSKITGAGSVTITGGTFSAQPPADWLAPWYKATETGGSYKVSKMTMSEMVAAGLVATSSRSSGEYYTRVADGLNSTEKATTYLQVDSNENVVIRTPYDGGRSLYANNHNFTGSITIQDNCDFLNLLGSSFDLPYVAGDRLRIGFYSTAADATIRDADLDLLEINASGDCTVVGGRYGDVVAHVYYAKATDSAPKYSADLTITGGSFAKGTVTVEYTDIRPEGIPSTEEIPLSDYVADGYTVVAGTGAYPYEVVPKSSTAAEVVAGDAAVSVSGTITGTEEKSLAESVSTALQDTSAGGNEAPGIGQALTAAAGTEANRNQVTAEQGKTALTEENVPVQEGDAVTIVVQPYLEISVADVSIEGETRKTVTLDITPMYITVATTADLESGENLNFKEDEGTTNAVQIGDAQKLTITKPVPVTLSLPENFANDGTLYIKHVKDGGATYYYKGSVTRNVLTFTNPNGFSLFSISTVNSEVVAVVGDQGYASLQEAVNAVSGNGTITLLKDGLSATVSRPVSFQVVSEAGQNYSAMITAGSGYTMTKDENGTYIFTYAGAPDTPETPSTPVTGGSEADGDYAVTVDRTTGGKVTVNPGRADRGDTVTITVKPNDGYELDTLTVTDKSGDTVKVTSKGNNKYTFTMPSGAVTVTATFVEDGQAGLLFTDVTESYWAYGEIRWAYENGYIKGSTATTFNPGGTITRQQVWMILARIAGENPASMAEAKAWAIANGVSDGSNPGGSVTRQQLVTILYRFAGQNGYDTTARADLSGYPDVATVASYATEAMAWAVAEGIIGGTAQGTLNPAGTASRAQFAVILYRYMA